jgi:hypothetical protein
MKRIISVILFPFLLLSQPAPVVILSPINNAVGLTNPITFVWTKSDQALAYTIQISTGDFTWKVIDQSIADTVYSTSALDISTAYSWRVRAENLDGASDWSIAHINTKINIPLLLQPSSNAIDIDLTPALQWNYIIWDASYTVELSMQPNFNVITRSMNTKETLVQLDSLEREKTYYWKVKARLYNDTSDYSEVRSFTTIPNIPAIPQLQIPSDFSTNIPVNVVFRWSKELKTVSYDIQISTSPVFSTILVDTTVTDTLYRPDPFLNSNTQYFWHVRSSNSGGTSGYSTIYRFTTGTNINEAKISIQKNIEFGTVIAGSTCATSVNISSTGSDDLLISSIENQLPIWTKILEAPSISCLIQKDSIILAGGYYRSTDYGKSWTNDWIAAARSYLVKDSNIFLGGISAGVRVSSDRGSSWKSTGLSGPTTVEALASNGARIFAATNNGVYISTDDGTNWLNSLMHGVIAIATTGSNILVGDGNTGIYRSTNNGTSWSFLNNNKVYYCIAAKDSTFFIGYYESGVYFSKDDGLSWSEINAGLENKLVRTFATSESHLFVGTNDGGMYRLSFNGSRWVNMGLTGTVICIAVDNNSLLAGTGSGVWRSDYIDLSSYILPSGILPNSYSSAVITIHSVPRGSFSTKIIIKSNALTSPDTVTVSGFGVGGMALNTKNVNMGCLTVGATKDTVITITNTTDVDLVINTISSDNPSFNARPSMLTISPGASTTDTLRFTPSTTGNILGNIILASNAPNSPDTIFITGKGEPLTDVAEKERSMPTVFFLSQNFPNPFNPTTTISFTVPHSSFVTIKIFNILGKEVAVLASEELPGGVYKRQWNARNISSGVYLCRMQAESFVAVKKLILLR